MAGRRSAPQIVLGEAERVELEALARRRKTGQAMAMRARIVLACAEGLQSKEVAADLEVDENTVGKWRRRFAERRLDGLYDDPPSGLSTSSVQRIWRAFGLQPHRLEAFKLSTDPDFVAKVRDVVGLYMSPPDRAIVLCVDEKSQIQALDRSQPMLPMRPGQPARMSHDYKRHGTTSLFAALDIATGAVIGKCYGRHRAREFRKFLDEIESNVPDDLDVHLVMDNYATHKTLLIRKWLAKRPRWHVHLTPTSASWLNQVERFFALITDRKIRRGIYRSVAALRTDIISFIEQHNEDPKPFRWTKSADDILASIERFCRYNTPPKAVILRTSGSGH
jgi:transposase